MQSNYMKAYFLRANQLIQNGSFRDAVPHLKAAAYYSPRQDPFNQLSRYWIAESYFRDGKYADARAVLMDLYNLSALDGKKEGDQIPYDIAYTFFKEEDYPAALKWFNNYLAGRHDDRGADAETRRTTRPPSPPSSASWPITPIPTTSTRTTAPASPAAWCATSRARSSSWSA